jgi:hypothetical protein
VSLHGGRLCSPIQRSACAWTAHITYASDLNHTNTSQKKADVRKKTVANIGLVEGRAAIKSDSERVNLSLAEERREKEMQAVRRSRPRPGLRLGLTPRGLGALRRRRRRTGRPELTRRGGRGEEEDMENEEDEKDEKDGRNAMDMKRRMEGSSIMAVVEYTRR